MTDRWELVEVNAMLSRFTVLNKSRERISHVYVSQIQQVSLKDNTAVVCTKGQRILEINLDTGLRKILA